MYIHGIADDCQMPRKAFENATLRSFPEYEETHTCDRLPQAYDDSSRMRSGQRSKDFGNILKHLFIALLAPVKGQHLRAGLELVDIGRQRRQVR